MAAEAKHLMFVYGTLKRGEDNYDLMIDQSRGNAIYQGSGHTTTKFPLVVATEYNIPFLLNVPGKGHEIVGDIYKVDDSKLSFLDDFEGHPDLYRREETTICLMKDEEGKPLSKCQEFQCSAYFLSETKEDFLKLKWLKNYSSISEEHPPYMTRYHRPVPLRTVLFPNKQNFRVPGETFE